jgi:hypothetical protein
MEPRLCEGMEVLSFGVQRGGNHLGAIPVRHVQTPGSGGYLHARLSTLQGARQPGSGSLRRKLGGFLTDTLFVSGEGVVRMTVR